MGSTKVIAGVVMLALGASPAHAQEAQAPLVLAGASDWVADYDDDSCALRRAFQSGEDRATLEVRQFGPGDGFQATLISPTQAPRQRVLKVRYEPDEASHEPSTAFSFNEGEQRGFVFNDSFRPRFNDNRREPLPEWPEAERDARERAITGFTITSGFARDLTIQTGAMHAPMESMRTCLDELLTHWGLDPAVQRTLSRRARPDNLQRWARRVQEVYPPAMVRENRSGIVHVRLIVGADGKAKACIPNRDFITPGFEDAACSTLKNHARFEPALDANGAPVETFYTTTVVYMLN